MDLNWFLFLPVLRTRVGVPDRQIEKESMAKLQYLSIV